jgi:hypothetical protein
LDWVVVPLAAELWGRDEDAAFEFSSVALNAFFEMQNSTLITEGPEILPLPWPECVKFPCISDTHKVLLVQNPIAIPFLDGSLGESTWTKTLPTEVQAMWQQANAEALAQLALFAPSREVLLKNPLAIAALEAVASFTSHAAWITVASTSSQTGD